jgi:hypothetical protein
MIVGSISAAYVEGTCLQNLVCLHGLHCRISEQQLSHTDVNTAVLFQFYGNDTVTPVCCASHAKDCLGDISNLAPGSSSFSQLTYVFCILLLSKIGSVAVNLFTHL